MAVVAMGLGSMLAALLPSCCCPRQHRRGVRYNVILAIAVCIVGASGAGPAR
jgi:hypothetical protein